MNHWRVAIYVPIVVAITLVTETLQYFPILLSLCWTVLAHLWQSLLNFYHDPNAWLLTVLAYRYYRFIGHLFAKHFLYSPTPFPVHASVTSRNVHVIIPTIDPRNQAFDTCIRSILEHHPRRLTIVTGGTEFLDAANEVAYSLRTVSQNTEIRVRAAAVQNKRVQINTVLNGLAENQIENQDTIIVCVDDHAWWQGGRFLDHLLAPFEDRKVALVGTRKEVVRMRGTSYLDSFINLVGCLYLERHNFEITGQNALDDGVLVVSARTCAIRASVILNEDFMTKYVDERFFFNMFGPLNSDDDNFVTRYILQQGYKIKFQNDPYNAICTDIGISGFWKIHGQLIRWARSQWRSNPASLFTEGLSWKHGLWWTSHAAYFAWFINAPIWMDFLVFRACANCTWEWFDWKVLLAIMIVTKVTKLFGHFRRHPSDLLYLPFYYLFTYLHVFYKLWALFTFWDTTWSGRKLKGDGNNDDDDGDDDGGDEGNDGDDGHSKELLDGWLNTINTPSGLSPLRTRGDDDFRNDFSPSGGTFNPRRAIAVVEGLTRRDRQSSSSSSKSSRRTSIQVPLSSNSSSPSSANSFTFKYGQHPDFNGRPNVFTPWGSVRTSLPHLKPADVGESQLDRSSNESNKSGRPESVERIRTAKDSPTRSSNYKAPSVNSIDDDKESSPRSNTSATGLLSAFRKFRESCPKASPSPPPTRELRRSPRNQEKQSPEVTLKHTQLPPIIEDPIKTACAARDKRKAKAGTKGELRSPTITCAREFYDKIPPLHLSSVSLGEDYSGLPSPIRPNISRFTRELQPKTEDNSIKRTNFSKPMPPMPKAPLIMKKDKDHDLSTQPRGRTVDPHNRQFVRGCDCQRIHGSGTWLALPNGDGNCRRCRSPRPNQYLMERSRVGWRRL